MCERDVRCTILFGVYNYNSDSRPEQRLGTTELTGCLYVSRLCLCTQAQIFVAKLSSRVREKDLEHQFSKYGPIKNILLKTGYAFIEYDDYRDAEEAIYQMDGKTFEGQRIVVEAAMGKRHDRRRDSVDDRDREKRPGKRGPQPDDACFNCGNTGHWANECREPPKQRGNYLKDKSKCYRCGERGHHQKECNQRSRSRSRSRSNSRSRSRSRSRSDSRSDSRRRHHKKRKESKSSSRSRSRSNSRSKDRSRSESRSEANGNKKSQEVEKNDNVNETQKD